MEPVQHEILDEPWFERAFTIGSTLYGALGLVLMAAYLVFPPEPVSWWAAPFAIVMLGPLIVGVGRGLPSNVRSVTLMTSVLLVAMLATFRAGLTMGPLVTWLALVVVVGLLKGVRLAVVSSAIAVVYLGTVGTLFHLEVIPFTVLPDFDPADPATLFRVLVIFVTNATLLVVLASTTRALLVRTRELEAVREKLMQMIVHDMRSPLTTIGLSLAWVSEEQTFPPEIEEALAYAEEQNKRLTEMVNTMLEMGRLQSGAMPLDLELTPLDSTIDRAVLELQAQVRARKLDVACEVAAAQSPTTRTSSGG